MADGGADQRSSADGARGRRRRRRWLRWVAIVAAFLLVTGVAGAWAADTKFVNSTQVMRNTELVGRPVGGLGDNHLRGVVAEMAAEYETAPVEIDTGDGTLETTLGDLGVAVNQEATVQAALDAGRGSMLVRPFDWLHSFIDPHDAPLLLAGDDEAITEGLQTLEGDARVPPIEPTIEHTEVGFVPVPGQDGEGLPADEVLRQIQDQARNDEPPFTISLEPEPLPPTIPDSEAEALAEEANQITGAPLTVEIGLAAAEIGPEALANWVVPEADGDELNLVIDLEQVGADLPEVLPDVGNPPTPATFNVTGFGIEIVPGQDGTGCCAEGSEELIADALHSPERTVSLELGPESHPHDVEWAESLQITEEISLPDEPGCSRSVSEPCRMTTHHACCETRVQNIHRIADLVRGSVIEPNGGVFSLNDTVGERTRENGFAEAGAIEQGRHVTAVGGGVSQFAATTFNAAFHAGLDIPSYQFHTEDLGRYPYGRESTVSYPEPDFEIQNNTPYGVLIWPTYTDTTITVHLYSTRFATGAQTGQSSSPRGSCVDITTQRTRTYVDGRPPEVDEFRGYYRLGGPTC